MRDSTMVAAVGLMVLSSGAGCRDARPDDMVLLTAGDEEGGDGVTSGATEGGGSEDDGVGETGEKFDVGNGDDGDIPAGCNGDADCELVDVLFVIDNSATMGEEQLNLAANFPRLIERLQNLENGGTRINADVNIMVTTTDFGHPLCTGFQKEDYVPSQGSPVFSGCNQRIDSFTSPHPFNPIELPEACTESCPQDVVPGGDPFIHFGPNGSNVPGGDVTAALSCLAPQGIDGCGYEAPLETMLQALRPEACWNDPKSDACQNDDAWSWASRGFVRPGSTLAIAVITDEADCSVAAPNGFSFFTDIDNDEYWLEDPEAEALAPSSAVCWRAGVDCVDADSDGVYESCASADENPVLHPTSRYKDFLAYIEAELHNDIVMLGVLGVPPVTAHASEPPFAPTEGGVEALVYRDWRDGEYDGTAAGGDILPAEWAKGVTAAHKQWEFGVGPGCTGAVGDSFTGQAAPPVRIREVCESLNTTSADGEERIRCCIESICDDDFSPAIDCLTGIIAETFTPEG